MLSDRCLSVCLSVLSVTLVYCGQTVGWIKMKLGTQVGLGPGHIALDGDPAPLPKRGRSSLPPIFGPYLLWPNGWMDQDAIWQGSTWYGSRSQPRPHCVRRDTQLPLSPAKRANSSPLFSAHIYCGHGRPSQLLVY